MLIQTRYQIQSQMLQQEAQAQMGPPPGQEQQGQQQGQQQQQQQAPAEQQQQQQQAPEQGQAAPEQQAQQPEQAPGVEQSPITQASSGNMVDLFSQAKRLTSELKKMDEVDRYRALARLRASNPEIYMLVNNALSGAGMSAMKALPEQRPPRTGPGGAQI